MDEIGRYLEQFQALRQAAGEKLAGLPEPLHQRLMTPWVAILEQREITERALLLTGRPFRCYRMGEEGGAAAVNRGFQASLFPSTTCRRCFAKSSNRRIGSAARSRIASSILIS